MSLVVVRYHEIALKRGNRPRFIARLAGNLRRATSDVGLLDIRQASGRLVLDFEDTVASEDATRAEEQWRVRSERIGWVFGVANFSPGSSCRRDMDSLGAGILEKISGSSFSTFRITCKRADKSYPMTSPEICREIGARVGAHTGAGVDLENADLTVDIELLPREALVSIGKVQGPGGLPVGSSGEVIALLSGGIDSPVAAARLMRRGCRVSFVHFHSAPYLDRTSQDKARELAALLTRHQFHSTLYLVPFGAIQREIVAKARRPHRVILYRRMMLRIAERIARGMGAEALVTGESVGQVASQTLTNMATIDAVASIPVLRPLVGCDKNEIVAEALRLGTYAISIVPDQDCCQLFVPRHPSTCTRLPEAEAAEEAFAVDELSARAVDDASVETFDFRRATAGDARGRPGASDGAVSGEAPLPGSRTAAPRDPRHCA